MNLLKQGAFWEAEGSIGYAVHKVQGDPLDLLTVKHDKVVLEDQERVFCDENKTLFFIVPVIHPETTTKTVLDSQ